VLRHLPVLLLPPQLPVLLSRQKPVHPSVLLFPHLPQVLLGELLPQVVLRILQLLSSPLLLLWLPLSFPPLSHLLALPVCQLLWRLLPLPPHTRDELPRLSICRSGDASCCYLGLHVIHLLQLLQLPAKPLQLFDNERRLRAAKLQLICDTCCSAAAL